MSAKSNLQFNIFIMSIGCMVGLIIGILFGFGFGGSWIREQCETHNTFYYKHNDTRYYCATEHQLKRPQK